MNEIYVVEQWRDDEFVRELEDREASRAPAAENWFDEVECGDEVRVYRIENNDGEEEKILTGQAVKISADAARREWEDLHPLRPCDKGHD